MQLIGFSNPSLFKFCAPEHNLVEGCNTVRLGTLWSFRKEENTHLRDEGEGEFEFRIEFPSLTPVSQAWISEIQVDNEGSARIGELQFNNGVVSLRTVSLKGSYSNGWIFCVSKSSSAAGNISKAHPSKWMISGEKVGEFGQYLGHLLWQSITADDLPADLLKNHSLQEIQKDLQLSFDARDVEYVERVQSIRSEADFPVEKLRELKGKIPYLKPKSFADENEFRFAFFLTFRGKRISIVDRPKILELRPIDKFISLESTER